MRTLRREEAAARAALLEVISYDIDLDLTGDGSGFSSTTVVRFSCRQPGASSFAELDAELLAATLNGIPVTKDGARIALPDLQADNELRVVARCAYSNTGEGLHRFVDPADGLVYVWGQSATADAQRIYACFDQPDLKAVFRLTVTAPMPWTVIGNGRGAREGERWTFAETQRMSTYLFTVAGGQWAGERRVHDEIELGVWCRQSLAEHLEQTELFEITSQCFDGFHELFGVRYPFGDTYHQLWVPEMNFGAMENPGAVTFSETLLFRSKVTESERRGRSVVIAHEMAHMWFGNLVTMAWWEDLWLNESFADLMGYVMTDRVTRFDGVWPAFCTGRKAWGYATDQLPTTHPIAGEVEDSASALLNVDGISYAKGASVLRQLMVLVGEDVFFEAIRGYLTRHAFGNTTLEDFLAAIEQASGRDLGRWADGWLRTAGVSTLRADGDAVVQQPSAAHPVLRGHRIGIGRYQRTAHGLVRDRLIDVEVQGAVTAVPGLSDPADMVLLNDADWTFAKIRFDQMSLSTVLADLRNVLDPLARALCWASLWDACRDAELQPRAFVEAVIAHASVETDPGVLATLLKQAHTAARLWAADPGLVHQLSEACRRQQLAAPAGSDLQLTWSKAWLTAATDPLELTGLLEGRGPRGLTVDTELRWTVVRRLATLGLMTEADLDAELERDPTSAGARHADFARAAQPDAAAKDRAWTAALTDDSLSNHATEACADAFWQLDQVELCRPYVDRYFDEIRAAWVARSPQVAQSLTASLYPGVVVEQGVLDRTAAFLADASLPTGLRRVILERGDDLRRAVAARAFSRT